MKTFILLLCFTVSTYGLIFQGTVPTSGGLNPKDFGAFGDGVHDDTAAIQAAIDGVFNSRNTGAARGLGGVVFLPSGLYRISNTIQLPPGVIIQGNGQGSTVITNTTSTLDSFAVRFAGIAAAGEASSEFTIRDLSINGRYAATAGDAINMSNPLYDAHSVAISPYINNVWILNHFGGITLSNAVRGSINHVNINRTSLSAIKLKGSNNSVKLEDLDIRAIGAYGFESQWAADANGITIEYGSGISIINSVVEGVRGNAYKLHINASSLINLETENFYCDGIILNDCNGVTLMNSTSYSGSAYGTNALIIDGGTGVALINYEGGLVHDWVVKLTNSATGSWPLNTKIVSSVVKGMYPQSVSNPELINVNIIAGYTANTNSLVNHIENIVSYFPNTVVTGTKKITLPIPFNSTQIIIKLNGFNMNGVGAWEATIGGYNSVLSGWTEISAKVSGHPPFTSIRLGAENSKPVILLGTTSTSWSYPFITVSDLYYGSTPQLAFNTGWTITNDTTESGVTGIVTPLFQTGSNRYYGAGAPSTTPSVVGDVYVDTTGKKVYFSTGTSSSADWTITN